MEKYQTFTLKNGIRGAVVALPGLKSATLEVFAKIGSKYETRNEFGLSHFLEHMAFKGTKKRPTAMDINNEIDAKGAMYNAGTGHEATSYFITTTKENMGWASEVLSDILLNSTYPLEEVEKERGVIMEEIRMYQDNPMMGLSGDFVKFLYGNSPIGCWNIAGEVEDIEKVNRDIIVNYHQRYFNPKEIVIVASGNVDESVIKILEDCFGSYSNSQSAMLPEVKVSVTPEKSLIVKKDITQGHFCVGVEAIPWTDKRRYALKLLDIILSGNTSSRLYNKIREEKAWAYYVFPVTDSFKETGFLGVQSGVKLDKLNEAMELVVAEMLSIKDNLKEEELKRAKEFLIGKTTLAMDRTDYVSGYVGEKILLENNLETIENELDRYNKVELFELVELSKELFLEDRIKRLSVVR